MSDRGLHALWALHPGAPHLSGHDREGVPLRGVNPFDRGLGCVPHPHLS
jgi:hypothetical protein